MKIIYKEVKGRIEKKGHFLLSKEYKNPYMKLKLRCSKGHEWDISFNLFRSGRNKCPECADKRFPYDYVKEYFEKEGYILLSKEYRNVEKKLKVRCPKGHEFETTFSRFKRGQRCPKSYTHQNEEECREIFERLSGNKFPTIKPKWMGRQHLDGYCEELQIAFEYNGKQHYEISFLSPTKKRLEYRQQLDVKKQKLCEEHGVELITIPYWIKNKEEYIVEQLDCIKKFFF